METIKEDYVSFQVARLLKEKGFDEPCQFLYFSKYKQEGDFLGNFNTRKNSEINELSYSAPTLQMAMKWLLKKHNIFICPLFLEESNGFGYTIEDIIKKKYIATSKNSSYKEPEEACETAIKYCLENLI